MKRFWLVLLSLGLVLAFSASAMAVDVKFNGEFYAAGVYLDKTKVRDAFLTANPSTAFYYQRLRLETDFVVSPGLKLVTRFDAMERIWGGYRSPDKNVALSPSAGTQAENENIAFDWAYIQYDSPIGTFKVGYMDDLVWGTVFNDSATPRGVIGWNYVTGPWNFIVKVVKATDYSSSAINPGVNTTDLDNDKYAAAVKYTWKGGEAGLLGAMYRDATTRTAATPYSGQYYALIPYAKAQIGPVKVQAEVDYAFGTWKDYETTATNVKLENLGVFVDAVADFGMFYAGGTFAYVSGDDPSTSDKQEGSPIVTGGKDWNPCLIMFNNDVIAQWTGPLPGWSDSSVGGPMTNAWFGQGRVGVRPVPALDIMASLSYAQADKKPNPWGWSYTYPNNNYGWEVDVTGTYKLTNNLSYMLGGGYLFTGDYYKGYAWGTRMNTLNNFMLINKLTLTF